MPGAIKIFTAPSHRTGRAAPRADSPPSGASSSTNERGASPAPCPPDCNQADPLWAWSHRAPAKAQLPAQDPHFGPFQPFGRPFVSAHALLRSSDTVQPPLRCRSPPLLHWIYEPAGRPSLSGDVDCYPFRSSLQAHKLRGGQGDFHSQSRPSFGKTRDRSRRLRRQ
ncbi:protein of unknown function [Streptomyces murinus]